MTWGELKAAAERLGVEDTDEICAEFWDYGGWSRARLSENYPSGAVREYETFTLTLQTR